MHSSTTKIGRFPFIVLLLVFSGRTPVPAGNWLEARFIVDTIKASKDMWLAYDTTQYPTVIKIP